MRVALLSIVLLVGCSGGNFTVASTPGTDGAIDDVAADDGASSADTESDTSAGGDSISASDSGTSDAITAEAGSPCTSAEECPGTNQWCKRAACGDAMGTCAPLETPNPYFAPVCGCDGITYWNTAHAEGYGVTRVHDGPCTPTEGKDCISGCDYCVHQLLGMIGCATGTAPGRCWRAPSGTLCTASMSGPSVSNCDGKCKSMCQAIKDKDLFYQQACTPG